MFKKILKFLFAPFLPIFLCLLFMAAISLAFGILGLVMLGPHLCVIYDLPAWFGIIWVVAYFWIFGVIVFKVSK